MVKFGVQFNGIKPETVLAIFITQNLFQKNGWPFTITSCTDGVHSPGSKHYVGFAFDVRTRDISPEVNLDKIVSLMRETLGPEYDVIKETTHIHVEFDPKR